jgi:beta-glucanase (GH16 family)
MRDFYRKVVIFVPIAFLCFACGNGGSQKGANKQEEQMDITPATEWTLVWADEFEGDALNLDNWNRQVELAGRFNEEWQRYTDSEENAYVENNQLVIKAIHAGEAHGLDQYTSARLNTANKQSWKYGKIAASIKLPEGKGIWPAFWMLGANIDENGGDTPWPQCGEVDILELYGTKDNGVVEANLHYADKSGKHAMMGAVDFKLPEGKFSEEFHVFELIWTPESISWLVDGEEYASTDITAKDRTEFHEEFFLLLNLAVGGTYAGYPDESTVFPQYMYVDWVRVYEQ